MNKVRAPNVATANHAVHQKRANINWPARKVKFKQLLGHSRPASKAAQNVAIRQIRRSVCQMSYMPIFETLVGDPTTTGMCTPGGLSVNFFAVEHCTNRVDEHKLINMRNAHARKIPAAWNNISRIFTALGDQQRQRILLSFEPGERLNVTQIAAASTLARPTVSHHLKVLRDAGVLLSQKSGKEVFYWIDKAFLQQGLGAVLDYINDET